MYLIAAVVLINGFVLLRRSHAREREAYIDTVHFHPAVLNKFREVRPHLTREQEARVFAALRDYFQLWRMAGRHMVAMPSQVVDDAWQAFILYTRSYEPFCARALAYPGRGDAHARAGAGWD